MSTKTKEAKAAAAASVDTLVGHISGKFVVKDGELELPVGTYNESLPLSGLTVEGADLQHSHDKHFAAASVRAAGNHALALFQADSSLADATLVAHLGNHGTTVTTKVYQAKTVRNPGNGDEVVVHGATTVTVTQPSSEIKAARQAVKDAAARMFGDAAKT